MAARARVAFVRPHATSLDRGNSQESRQQMGRVAVANALAAYVHVVGGDDDGDDDGDDGDGDGGDDDGDGDCGEGEGSAFGSAVGSVASTPPESPGVSTGVSPEHGRDHKSYAPTRPPTPQVFPYHQSPPTPTHTRN